MRRIAFIAPVQSFGDFSPGPGVVWQNEQEDSRISSA